MRASIFFFFSCLFVLQELSILVRPKDNIEEAGYFQIREIVKDVFSD